MKRTLLLSLLALTLSSAASEALPRENRVVLLLCRHEGDGRNWLVLGTYDRIAPCDRARAAHAYTGHQVQCSFRDLDKPNDRLGITYS